MSRSIQCVVCRGIIFVLTMALMGQDGFVRAQTDAQQPPAQEDGAHGNAAPAAQATSGPTSTTGIMLVQLARQKSVQAELGVDKAQNGNLGSLETRLHRHAAEALRLAQQHPDRWRGQSGSQGLVRAIDTERNAAAAGLTSILNADQYKRLEQIALQLEGPSAILKPEVVNKLQLTREQIKKLGRLTPWDSKRVAGLLNEQQLATWQDMVGAPFHGKMTPLSNSP